MIGTVVVNERVYEIRNLRLHEGLLHLDAWIKGPIHDEGGLAELEIFGDDGSTICHLADYAMPPVHATRSASAYFTMSIDAVGVVR